MLFISYSRSEVELARAVAGSLSSHGLDCWLDESNIPVGQAFVEHLGAALRRADSFLLVDTPASRSSYWVTRELETAMRLRRGGWHHTSVRLAVDDNSGIAIASFDYSLSWGPDAAPRLLSLLRQRTPTQHPDACAQVPSLNKGSFSQPQNWTGRQSELRALDTWWLTGQAGICIHGAGGSGKSGLLQTWVTVLRELGFDDHPCTGAVYVEGRESDVPTAQSALTDLVSRESAKHVLLAIDGHDEAADPRALEGLVLQTLSLRTRTLITSRRELPPQVARHCARLELATMARRDAVAMLNDVGVAYPANEEIAEAAGDYPLAIVLVRSLLANGKASTSEVLDALRQMPPSSQASLPPQEHSLQVALERSLSSLSVAAMTALRSLCSTSDTDSAILTKPSAAFGELARRGLINVNHLDSPTNTFIHPVVRAYVNKRSTEQHDKASVL